jgi:hypothetical protein
VVQGKVKIEERFAPLVETCLASFQEWKDLPDNIRSVLPAALAKLGAIKPKRNEDPDVAYDGDDIDLACLPRLV